MTKSILLSSAIIALAVSSARADTFVNDGFNGLNPGQYVNGTGSIWSSGSVTYSASYNVSGYSSESPFTAETNGRSASINDSSTTAGTGMGMKATFTAITSQPVHISFDYYVDSLSLIDAGAGTLLFAPTMILGNNAGGGGLFLTLAAYDSTTEKYYLTNVRNSGNSQIAEVSLQTWYHVDLTASAATDTYSLTLTPFGGTSTAPQIYNFRVGLGDIGSITFSENNAAGAKGNFLIDNVLVDSVPEPAALGFLSCGLLLGLIRRH